MSEEPSRSVRDVTDSLAVDIDENVSQPIANNVFLFGGPRLQTPASQNGAIFIEEGIEVDPRMVMPKTMDEAQELFRKSPIDNATCKSILKSLNISGGQNAKVSTKVAILCAKMVQRQFTVSDALTILDFQTGGGEGTPPPVGKIRQTAVKVKKLPSGEEEFEWVKGDIPVYEDGEVAIGKPDITGQGSSSTVVREPAFEAAEYCRLLHVLADDRMTVARTQLMEPRSREELDASEMIDPWSDHVVGLYNDAEFTPAAIGVVCGGITRNDICSIDPSVIPHERNAGVLKRKFGEFKSLYGNFVCKYEASGQGDPDMFVHFANGKTHVMYAFCFLKQHPILTPLATRALQSDSQREEGVGNGVEPEAGSSRSGRKRKREAQQISIVGIQELSSAFKPVSWDVAKETEEAERDKVKFEAAEARGQSARFLLSAIAQAKEMEANASTLEEKVIYADLAKELVNNLRGNEST